MTRSPKVSWITLMSQPRSIQRNPPRSQVSWRCTVNRAGKAEGFVLMTLFARFRFGESCTLRQFPNQHNFGAVVPVSLGTGASVVSQAPHASVSSPPPTFSHTVVDFFKQLLTTKFLAPKEQGTEVRRLPSSRFGSNAPSTQHKADG